MGSSGSKGKNKKDFQSVIPYSDKLSPVKPHMRKSVAPLITSHIANTKAVELDRESISAIREVASKGWTPNPDFQYTEGRVRRSLMQSCEEECSEITNYLFVGGVRVDDQTCVPSIAYCFVGCHFTRSTSQMRYSTNNKLLSECRSQQFRK